MLFVQMYSNGIKKEAIRLRKEGNTYHAIASKLQLSKSTLSDWLKSVDFLPNEMAKVNLLKNSKRLTEIKRLDKAISLRKATLYALEHIKELTERDLFVFGLGIYLGEGSKVGNYIRIANSDPRILRCSMIWFKKCFGLSNANFRVRVHIYPDNNENRVIRFWMKELHLKRQSFFSSYVDTRLNKKKNRKGVLPYGTAHLSVLSKGNKDLGVLLQRKIIASIDFILDQYKT